MNIRLNKEKEIKETADRVKALLLKSKKI